MATGTINAAQVIGRTIYAPNGRSIKVYSYPSFSEGVLRRIVKPKGLIGVVYSWVGVSPSFPELWWEMIGQNGIREYVKHEPDLTLKSVQEQNLGLIDELLSKFGLQNNKIAQSVTRLGLGAVAIYGVKSGIEVAKKIKK